MTADDRIALQLGRAVMYAVRLETQLEQLRAELAARDEQEKPLEPEQPPAGE